MDTLYYSPGACSLAPHILFEETGLPFEARRVTISDGEHLKPAYIEINPRGRVPTLITGGVIVTESPALLLAIAARAPEKRLVPPPGATHARCMEWLFFLSSGLHIAYAQLWRPQRFLPSGTDTTALVDFGRSSIVAYNADIERRLGAPWAIGESYSVADPYLLPFYRWGVRIGLDMEKDVPRWTAWKNRMLERPAVQRAIEREGIGSVWKAT